jgi:type II secretory ATPase GspE/PulE/Tfp pilus assembly ATPase PilB-like protein
MGAEAFLVASTVNVVIGQRLVRKLCNECKTKYILDAKDVEALKKSFNMDDMLEVLKKSEATKGIVGAKSDWKDVEFYKAKGCEQCSNEGYRGRVGIYEVLEMDESIGKLITSNASADEIEKKARENGMQTMGEDGFVKAVSGLTSLEEILRVTNE